MRSFLPLPSNLDLTKPGAVAELNRALRRLSDQIPGPESAAAIAGDGGTVVLYDTAANLPGGLSPSAKGTLFLASDTAQVWRWSGSAWVDVPVGSNDASIAYSSGGLGLTAVMQDVPGATITLSRDGKYLVTACFEFGIGTTNQLLTGELMAGGVSQAQTATTKALSTGIVQSASQQWIYTGTAGAVLKLRAKAAGVSVSTVNSPNTSLSVLWVTP